MDVPVPVTQPPAELAGAAVGEFEARLLAQVEHATRGVVVDLDGVRFVDSSGLGALVKAGLRLDAGQKRLALARPREAVARAIGIVGLGRVLRTFPSVESARAYVEGAPAGEEVAGA